MSSIKLDIGKFKHVKTEGNATTLRHKDGHEITLAHSKLSPENQKALSALAGLGKAAATPLQANEARDQKMATGGQPSNPKLTESKKTLPKQMPSMAIENITSPGDEPGNQGGGMAEGGQVNPSLAESKKHIVASHPNTASMIDGRIQLADGGDAQPPVVIVGQTEDTPPAKQEPQEKQIKNQWDTAPTTWEDWKQRVKEGLSHAEGGEIKTPWITPDKPQQPETPESKHQQNLKDAERRRKIERKQIKLNYDEGGQVPMPSTESTIPAPAPIKKNEVDSAGGWSKALSNLAHPWAEGGEVCPSCKRPHYDGGGNIQDSFHNKPGMPQRKMYADPEESVSKDDAAPQAIAGTPDIGGVQQIVPFQTAESPHSMDMAAKRKEYNDIVAAHNAGFFADPEDMSGVGPTRKGQFGPNDEPPQQFDPKAWQQMEAERQQAKDANAAQVAKEAINTAEYNKAAQSAGLPTMPTMDIPGNQNTNDVTQMPQAQPQEQVPSQAQSSQAQSDVFGMGSYNQGVNELAKIQKIQLANQIQERQTAMDTFKSQNAELESERRAHIADIQNGYIDPDKYWHDHSKVAAGIGMILAGFNPTNRPNAAIDFLQNQINRSIESQKANLAQKNNLLSANLQHFGDIRAATLMTNAMLNDQLATKMQQAALTAKNPLAKQAALGAGTQLMQNAMMFQQQLAMRQTMMKLANGGGTPGTQEQAIAMMSAVNPEGAKVYRDAFVPGVGMSKSLTPVPDNVRQQIASGQKLENATQDLLNYVNTHTNINPMSAEYQVGVTKGKILQQMIREGLLGTVFRESEKPLLESFVNENPANVLKRINSDPKLKTLLESTANQLNTLKQTYGLPTAQVPSQQQQPQYKTVNGIKYMRGPQGQAIPVK